MQHDTIPPCGHCTTTNVVRLNTDTDVADTVLGKGVSFRILLNKTVTSFLLIQGQWMAFLGKVKVYTCVFPPSSLVETELVLSPSV